MITDEMILYVLIFAMLLVGVSSTAILALYVFAIFMEFPLYALPFIAFLVSLLAAAYILAKKVVPSNKDFLMKLTVVFGAMLILTIMYSIMAYLFQTFVLGMLVGAVQPYAEFMPSFMNLLYIIIAYLFGLLACLALLGFHWKGNRMSKYLLTILTIVMIHQLGSPPGELLVGLLFLGTMWGRLLLNMVTKRQQ